MNTNTRRVRPALVTAADNAQIKAERDALLGLCQSLVWYAGGRSSTADLVKEAVAYLDSIDEGRNVAQPCSHADGRLKTLVNVSRPVTA
jgi:hypothetical protein